MDYSNGIDTKDNSERNERIEKAKKQFLLFFQETIPESNYGLRECIFMNDGEYMSVQASDHHYSFPRERKLPRYSHYEIGFPSELFDELEGHGEEPDTAETVFPYVEEDIIVNIIANHGGIDFEKSLGKEKCEKVPEIKKMIAETKAESKSNSLPEMSIKELSDLVSSLAKMVEEQRKLLIQMEKMNRSQFVGMSHGEEE